MKIVPSLKAHRVFANPRGRGGMSCVRADRPVLPSKPTYYAQKTALFIRFCLGFNECC